MPSELLRPEENTEELPPLSKKKKKKKNQRKKKQKEKTTMHWRRPELAIVTVIMDGEGPRETTGKRCHRIGRALADLEKRRVYMREDLFCMYWLCMRKRVQLYVSVCVRRRLIEFCSSNCQTSTMQCSQNQKMKKTLTPSTNEKPHE